MRRPAYPLHDGLVLGRLLASPIFRDGTIVCVLGVGNKPAEYDANYIRTPETFADLVWDILEVKWNDGMLEANANRIALLAELSRTIVRETDARQVSSISRPMPRTPCPGKGQLPFGVLAAALKVIEALGSKASFISKPFQPVVLANRIRELLDTDVGP